LKITHVGSTNSRLQQQNRLAGDTYRQALPTSRPPGEGHVPPLIHPRCRYRLAEPPLLLGARAPSAIIVAAIAGRKALCRQASQVQGTYCVTAIAWRFAHHRQAP